MMTLLMTFFIVLLTFSTFSTKKFLQAQSSIQRAFQLPIVVGISPVADLNDRRAQQIQEKIEQRNLSGIRVQDFGDRIILTMDSGIAFQTGTALLTPEGSNLLAFLLPILSEAPGQVRVEGHTCAEPIVGPFTDAWELSSARAARVVERLVEAGLSPKRVAIAGYADQRPVAPLDTESNRARNRRTEFVIEKRSIPADQVSSDPFSSSRLFDE
jgi:chemotaxis protein MotB